MGECSCWRKYPNEWLKKDNGRWKCVDLYECIRDCNGHYGYGKKTKCKKVREYEFKRKRKAD